MSDDGRWDMVLRPGPGSRPATQVAEGTALIERASPEERRKIRDRLEAAGDWEWIATIASAVAEVEKDPMESAAWRELASFAHRRNGAHGRAAALALDVARSEVSTAPPTGTARDPRARAWQTIANYQALLENWPGVVTAIDASLERSAASFYAQTAIRGVGALLDCGDVERAKRWLERGRLHVDDERDDARRSSLRVEYLSYESLVRDRLGDSAGAIQTQREAVRMAEELAPSLQSVARLRLAQLLVARDANESLLALESLERDTLTFADQIDMLLIRASAAITVADLALAVRACHEAATKLSTEPPYWPAALTTWRRVIQASAATLGLLNDPVCDVVCRSALSCLDEVRDRAGEPVVGAMLGRQQRAFASAIHDLRQLLEVRVEGIVRTQHFLIDFGQKALVRLATGARTRL